MLKLRFFFLILLLKASYSNAQEISLAAGDLANALTILESKTSWVFNFDPNAIEDTKISKKIQVDLDSPTTTLEKMLKDSKLDFEINGEVILLFIGKQRETNICGSLFDSSSGRQLPFAHVFVDNHFGTWTDDDGDFEFRKSMWKNEKVHVSYLGYKNIILNASKFWKGCQDLSLEKDAMVFSEEIVVRDYVLPSITKGQAYNSYQINLQSMHNEMGVIEKDIFKNLQFLPGVNSLDESASNLSIRGASSDQNLILWEGSPFYGNGHFFGMISSINPFVHKKVDLYKTVHHSRYDNRIGGVIDIRLPEDRPEKVGGGFGTTMTEFHGDLELPITSKLSLSVAGRHSLVSEFDGHPTFRSYGDKLFQGSTLMQEEIELEENISTFRSNFHDFNAKLFFSPMENLKFTSSVFRSKNTFFHQYTFIENQIQGIDSFNVSNSLWSNKVEYEWSSNSVSSIQVNQSDLESEYIFSLAEDLEEEEGLRNLNQNSISDLQFKLEHQHHFERANLDFGYIFDRKEVTYLVAESSLYEADFEFSEDQLGSYHHAFVNLDYRFKKWSLNAGLRATYDSEYSTTRFSPRINIRRPIKQHFNISFSAGVFHQYIRQLENYTESQLNIDNKVWFLGDEDIMTAGKFSFGANYQRKSWLVEAEVYYHQSEDVSLLNTMQSETLGIEENGQSLSRGLEVLIKKRWDNFNSAISYNLSYLDMRLLDLEDEYFPSNNDQRHNFSWINYFHQKNWNFGVQYFFRSGIPYTEITSLTLVEEEEEEYYEVEIDGFNSGRLGYFHRIDASVSYNKAIGNWAYFDVQFLLLNIFDFGNPTSRNEILTDIDPEDEEPEIVSIEKYQLQRTPQILLRFTF